jgi:hypothetical protein
MIQITKSLFSGSKCYGMEPEYQQRVISFPLNFGINDPPLPPLIRGVGGIEFVAGIFLIDIK